VRQILMLVPLVILALTSPAAAQSDELAKGHYMAGKAYYDQARYAEAIREFEEAYRLSPKNDLLFNIAQAHERAGHLDKAVEYLKRYLADASVKDRASVSERLRNLEARLQQTGITLQANVDGATVEVDGKAVGKTPLSAPIQASPGSHELKVSREGYLPFSAFISVSAGSMVTVNAKLTPGESAGQSAPTPRAHRRGYTWTWVTGGVAAALLITCAVTGGLALGKAGDAVAVTPRDESKADSARKLALISDVTLGVGLAAAATATVLFFYERKWNREAQPRTVVAPYVGRDVAGIGARFAF